MLLKAGSSNYYECGGLKKRAFAQGKGFHRCPWQLHISPHGPNVLKQEISLNTSISRDWITMAHGLSCCEWKKMFLEGRFFSVDFNVMQTFENCKVQNLARDLRSSWTKQMDGKATETCQKCLQCGGVPEEFFQFSRSLENALGGPSLRLKLVSYAACARSLLCDLEAGAHPSQTVMFCRRWVCQACFCGRGGGRADGQKRFVSFTLQSSLKLLDACGCMGARKSMNPQRNKCQR